MLLQQIMQELQALPEDKLAEIYNLIHYYRLGLTQASDEPPAESEAKRRTPGLLKGHVGDAFFEPMTEEELQEWE
ncbi:hypothetical protein [Halomicronema sp. CCY15110]|uniref:hypothetical protein n=1 Tax=Halomicronema sp. CCY15110 TaxID=2767773 RepID=UPI00194EE035|nr:hypothetical protein [Halomicronema sp. CCY15110]